MKRHTTLVLLSLVVLTALAFAAPRPNPGRRKPIAYEALRTGFAQPDMLYAPFAFWFWDEPLSTAKMAGMAAKMASVGMNPGYAHARMSMVGTPSLPGEQWLGDPWFTAFSASLTEARTRGAYLGYCDEYWWPSFQAHGRVLKQDPTLQAVSLSWRTFDVRGGSTVELPACEFATAAQRVHPAPAGRRPRAPMRMGRWIWAAGGTPTEHACRLRRVFQVPADRAIAAARVRATCDNAFDLYLDGKPVLSSDSWYVAREADVQPALSAGPHTLAVLARNLDSAFGFTGGLLIEYADGGTDRVLTDGSWRGTLAADTGWEAPAFDDSGWQPAAVIGEPGAAPWNLQQDQPEPHTPAMIRSATLRRIGGGKVAKWVAPAGADWRVYAFSRYEHGGVDGGQVNCLDSRLAPTFIKLALEPYARRMGAAMGAGIPGDFIDHEGAFGWRLAWSNTLAARYRARYGVDLQTRLPLMADQDEEGAWASTRWQWFDLVSELYASQFQALTDWHESRGMSTTAHVWEESMPAQVYAVGDHMRLLRALTMPGQDCLGEKALYVHDFKEIASVAEFGGRRATTELMGAAGWGTMTPAFMKQAVNAITAWGMSHVIPHAVFATRKMTGNPWPPDFYEENPMFPQLGVWTDFIRRTSYVNSFGHAVPDVLLYNPIESLWTLADYHLLSAAQNLPGLVWTWPEEWPGAVRANAIDRSYSKAMQDLTDARVEFLIGDRHYLSQMQVAGGALHTGAFTFRSVVLPPLEILPISAARKLLAFAQSGGRVFALGELPGASAERGADDPEMAEIAAALRALPTFTQCPMEPAGTKSRWDYGPGWVIEGGGSFGLAPLLARSAAGLRSPARFVSGAFPLLQRRIRVGSREMYWLANNTGKPRSAQMEFAGARGAAEIWDCESGTVRPAGSSVAGAGSRVALEFGPYEGYWLAFDPSRPARAPAPAATRRTVATLEGPWRLSCDAAEQPVLEYPVEIPEAMRAGVDGSLGSWAGLFPPKFSGVVDYTSTVDLPSGGGRMLLDLGEVRHTATVTVNGRPCGSRIWAPHVFDVSAALRAGTNTITIRVANLVNNNYGDYRESGLLGPVRILAE